MKKVEKSSAKKPWSKPMISILPISNTKQGGDEGTEAGSKTTSGV
jgi:hypothetical protein